jgi:ketosteroid isomerase-like protein
MSQENVEIVRQVIDANRSDDLDAAIETALALWDPTAEFTSVMAAVEPETYRGHDGLRRYFGDLSDAWKEWSMVAEEVLAVGPDTVLATLRTRLIGKRSGVAVEATRALVCVLSEGKIVRGHTYASRGEALEAVGLQE